MDRKIFFDENKLIITINNLKNIRNRLKIELDNQNQNVKTMQYLWKGTTGEKAYDMLIRHNKKYEKYLNMVDKRILFLEKVKKLYKLSDNLTGNKIDDNFMTKL